MTKGLVVLSYNQADYINTFFQNSDFSGFDEIVVVDDGSTDNSLHLLNAVLQNSPYKLISNETNLGFLSTYKIGVSALTTDVYTCLGLDDFILSSSFLRKIDAVKLFVCNFNSLNLELNRVYRLDRDFLFFVKRISSCLAYKYFRNKKPFMQPVNWIIPRDYVVDYLFEKFETVEDAPIMSYFLKRKMVKFINKDFVCYNNIGFSLSRTEIRDNVNESLVYFIGRKLSFWTVLKKIFEFMYYFKNRN